MESLERWHLLIESFREAGIKLIMIMDGPDPEENRSVWIKRSNARIEKSVYPTFDYLKDISKSVLPDKVAPMIPQLNTKLMLTQILGAEVITSRQAADCEIARMAKNNDACIGILGRDSDYLIYQTGGVPLLSITDLDILTLKTKLYDPRRLASWLDLRTSLLPLFAILAAILLWIRNGW